MSIEVTIGIIARNEEKNIASTLEHILKQSFNHKRYEIIVVDGNSSDKTREIANKMLQISNVKYKVLNEADYGFYGHCFARNLVVDQGDPNSVYVAYTDADCEVDADWLSTLYHAIEGTAEDVAGAGGPRLIADTEDSKELVTNALLTSLIASGGNPAFSRRDIKYTKSIANYNCIYKKKILTKNRYDDKLITSDDNELNFRLRGLGYIFLNVPDAKVWHHETNSITQFARNMFSYGVNITNTVRKHRSIVTINVPITIIFIFYLILLTPLYQFIGSLILIPMLLYLMFAFAVFIEVAVKTKTIYSVMVFILLPIQHISYGIGAMYNLLYKRKPG